MINDAESDIIKPPKYASMWSNWTSTGSYQAHRHYDMTTSFRANNQMQHNTRRAAVNQTLREVPGTWYSPMEFIHTRGLPPSTLYPARVRNMVGEKWKRHSPYHSTMHTGEKGAIPDLLISDLPLYVRNLKLIFCDHWLTRTWKLWLSNRNRYELMVVRTGSALHMENVPGQ